MYIPNDPVYMWVEMFARPIFFHLWALLLVGGAVAGLGCLGCESRHKIIAVPAWGCLIAGCLVVAASFGGLGFGSLFLVVYAVSLSWVLGVVAVVVLALFAAAYA